MSSLHFLNVRQGDCIVVHHGPGRTSVFDICCGNLPVETIEAHVARALTKTSGNFRMCEHPTNPVEYLKRYFPRPIWRFVLSHPDMDHLDGFDALVETIGISNFWDSGVRREKPDFDGSPYREEDWNRYVKVRDGKEAGVTVVTPKAGSTFKYANRNDDGSSGADGLYVLAPDQNLVDEANKTGDFNDASYVLLYRSVGGRIVIPGDAHDKTWEYVLENFEDDVRDCSLLIAPHHGRKSGRSYEFLKTLRPKLTLFGCAPSEYLAYDAWNQRKLPFITNNQAGCVVAECSDKGMRIYVENDSFASAAGGNTAYTNAQGFYFLCTIPGD